MTAKRLLQQGKLRELLEVPANAVGVDLEKACRAARVRHHPDKGGCHELACIIDEAIRSLKETAQGSVTKPNFPWKAKFVYVVVSEHEATLRKECQILESGITNAIDCLEKCGYGDNRPPCSESCDCHCTGHNALRLRNSVQSLDVLISWAEDALNEANYASNVGSGEELLLMGVLQDLIEKSKGIKHRCNTRANLFDELSCMPHHTKKLQTEHQEPQTSPSNDSAEAATPIWQCCIELCSRADSGTSHNIMKYIAKAFGNEAAEEISRCYQFKAICWHGGTKRVIVDVQGRYLRLRHGPKLG